MEGVLSKDMSTVGEYLQTWKPKVSTMKTVSAALDLNMKEDYQELNVNYSNEILPFCPESKCFEVTLVRSLTYRRQFELLRKELTSWAALLRWLAYSSWCAGATTL